MHEGSWSNGFIFRRNSSGAFHIVIVHSNGSWYHFLRSREGDDDLNLVAEYSSEISTAPNGSNVVRIITSGSEGWLFINDAFAGSLDLSGLTGSGSVSAVGSYFKGDGLAGESTRFENLIIRSLRKLYGPRDGDISHDPDGGFIDDHETYVSLNDGIIEARFFNPYAPSQGDWSNGFLFRESRNGEFHVIVIQEDRRWHHDLRLGDAETTQDLAEEHFYDISTGMLDSNHLRVIALENDGWFFINGVYVAKLDLSGWSEAGRVSAITNYFTGDGIAGDATRFEGFAVWSADGK